MIIKSIALKNFTCFIDEIFVFERGMNLVSARNGGGKSQIFNGFYWAIFGQVYNRSEGFVYVDEDSLLPAYYKDGAMDRDIKISVEVRLEGEHILEEGDVEYCFLRSATIGLDDDGTRVERQENLEISIIKQGETDFIESGLHDSVIDQLFPPGIRKFMWYVGETMKELIDFQRGAVLEYALDQISYYPKYKRLSAICENTGGILQNKSARKLKKEEKLSRDEKKDLADLEIYSNRKKDILVKLGDVGEKLREYESEQEVNRDRLKAFDHFIEYQKKLSEIEIDLSRVKLEIDAQDQSMRSKLVSTWMLNGTRAIVEESEKNLLIVEKAFKELQDKANPVPNTLPGSDYVQKMIDDCYCYICEREIENGDEKTLESLKKRLNDISLNRENEIMTENYEALRRFKGRFMRNYPKIERDIQDAYERKEKLNKRRLSLERKKRNLFVDLDIPESARQTIVEGATNAGKLTKEFDLRRKNIDKEIKKKQFYENEIKEVDAKISACQRTLREYAEKIGIENVEGKAHAYVDFVGMITCFIRDDAYSSLIRDVENLSNELYDQYLSERAPAQLVINKGELKFYDPKTNLEIDPSELSHAQEHAGKLAIVNSILKLSEKKVSKSYPLIMDAPTSDFDPTNVISITRNMATSFDQIIIMSKDYDTLNEEELRTLVNDANINKMYRVDQELFEKDKGWKPVSNRYSVKETLK